ISMLKIAMFLAVIFLLLFIALLWFFRRENKKEDDKDNMAVLIGVSILFSLIITLAIGFLLLLIVGSITALNTVFSLNISVNQMILIAVSFLIYWFTLDYIFEATFEHIFGENWIAVFSLTLSRIAAFYIIGILFHLNEPINLVVAVGVPLIIVVLDILSLLKTKKA